MRLRAAALALSALLGACATVGPDFERPEASGGASYAMAGDDAVSPTIMLDPSASTPVKWWTAFDSDDLNALVADALMNNPSLAEADATLEQARAVSSSTRGEALPQVDAEASVVRERINVQSFGLTGFPSPTISLYSIGPSVSFDLDLFGGRRRASERDQALVAAEAARVDAAYLTLSGDVVRQAVLIAGLNEKIAAQADIVAADRRVLEMVNIAIQAGGQPQSAANAVQAQLAEDEVMGPPLRQQLAEARHRLAFLLGRAPNAFSPPDLTLDALTPPGAVPVTIPSELVRRRPDILAAEADLHAATAEIGVSTAALYPNIALNASWIQGSIDPDTLFNRDSAGWSIGPSITAPLFHGGSLRADVRGSEAAARASYARYQQVVLGAFVQVADVMQAIGHDQEAVAAQARAVDAAAANLQTAEFGYQNGAGALFSVIDAQRQLHRARLAAVDARAQLYADLAALYVATAADWRVAAQ